MAAGQLASAGDDIRIWDCNTGFSLVKQYNPHSHNISCLNWSHDNQLLASTSTAGDKVTISVAKTNVFKTAVEFGIGESKTCVSFNSSSRNLIGGGKDGTVTLWEIRSQKVRKSYKSHKGSVTTVQFNWNDTYIASGAETGEILLYNVITGVESSPLMAPRTQAVRELQFSYFKKSLLASVSDDGAVNLWDTNTRRHLHPFRDVHKAPATGLSFSPLNDMLLLSVGLDKRIVCYDVLGKNYVKTITAESPLTSIDLHHNGVTLAVGSTRGKIYIYDLRNNSDPVHTISCAHKSSVQYLSFQHDARAAAKSGVSSSARMRSATPSNTRPSSAPVYDKDRIPTSAPGIQRAQTPAIKSLTDKTNFVEKSPIARISENGSFDAISPLREGLEPPQMPRKKSDLAVMSENRPELARLTPNSSNVSADSNGIFSPVTQGNKFVESYLDGQQGVGAGLYSPINPQPVSLHNSAKVNTASGDAMSKVNTSTDLLSKVNSSSDILSKFSTSADGTRTGSVLDSGAPTSAGRNSQGRSERGSPQKLLNGYNHVTNGHSPPSRDESRSAERWSPEKKATDTDVVTTTPTKSTSVSGDRDLKRGRASPRPRSLSRLGGAKRDHEGHSSLPSNQRSSTPLDGAGQAQPATTSDWDFLAATKHEDDTRANGREQKSQNLLNSRSYHAANNGQRMSAGEPPGRSVDLIAGQVTSSIVDGLSERGLAGTGDSGSAALAPIHVEFMRNVIRDSMEEFRDQVHADIKNMHYELIRQFSIQMEQMREMMQAYSVNGELLSEIEQLREENRRLKKNF